MVDQPDQELSLGSIGQAIVGRFELARQHVDAELEEGGIVCRDAQPLAGGKAGNHDRCPQRRALRKFA
jgi:hypothetical protein